MKAMINVADYIPDSVLEQRVAGRTLNTDCGAHRTIRMFSSENDCDG